MVAGVDVEEEADEEEDEVPELELESGLERLAEVELLVALDVVEFARVEEPL